MYSYKGVLFSSIEDYEQLPHGATSTSVLAEAIQEAMDAGKTTPIEISRYLCTNAFRHVPNKRLRYSSIVRASDATGARIIPKLVYLARLCSQAARSNHGKDNAQWRYYHGMMVGIANAYVVMMYPFTVEDAEDPNRINMRRLKDYTQEFVEAVTHQ